MRGGSPSMDVRIDSAKAVSTAIGRAYGPAVRKRVSQSEDGMRSPERDAFVISPRAQQLRTQAEIIRQTIAPHDTRLAARDLAFEALRGRVHLESELAETSDDPVGTMVEDVMNHIVGARYDAFQAEFPTPTAEQLDVFAEELGRALDEGFAGARDHFAQLGELPESIDDALDRARDEIDERLAAFRRQLD